MIEESNSKKEEAENTISPEPSEHLDSVEQATTENTDEINDEIQTSTEASSVENEPATAVDQANQDTVKAEPGENEVEAVVETSETPTEVVATTTDVVEAQEVAVEEKQPDEQEVDASIAPNELTTPEEIADSATDIAEIAKVEENVIAEPAQEAAATEPGQSTSEAPIAISPEETEAPSQEDSGSKEEKPEEHKEVDYTTLSKEELVEIVKAIAKDDNVVKADKVLMAVKPHIDKFRIAEREEAKVKFLADGGAEDDFEFKHDELSTRFDANYRLIKDRKSKHYKEQEKSKDENLKKKQDLLERIREFVDSDETNISFEKFKTLQNEWKGIGMVPNAYNKTLWANYNALMDRFYDHRSIYFELKELDRKKNLEAKSELCNKAEALDNEPELNVAIKVLNELHEEFKHLGPVPKQEQEPLWQRFKAASDAVYAKRKDYVDNLKVSQEENLKIKLELVEKIRVYIEFNSDRIKEWNEKTKEVLALQKEWEKVGGMPREKAKQVNKEFWGAFKGFFHNKGDFFKALDAKREGNLAIKKELIQKAQEIKDSTDWMKTTNELINLQKEWKESGPVPEKYRNSTYKEFKEACDYFFDQKRIQNKVNEGAYGDNFEKKKAICEKIEALAAETSADIDAFRTLQDDFNNIGFVPKKDIGTAKSLFSDAVDKFINAIPDIDNEERQRIRLENQLTKLANDPNAEQKIFRKEQSIRKQIGKLENDISLWKNNMEFFASSKNADKVRAEFEEKIDVADKELQNLKQQLRVLRSME